MRSRRFVTNRAYYTSVVEEALIQMYQNGELEPRLIRFRDGTIRTIYHSKLDGNV